MFYMFDQETKEISTTDDVREWGVYFQTANRKIGHDEINNYIISTVFLGLDHGFTPNKDPLLFETMIFDKTRPTGLRPGSFEDVYMKRYATYDEALATHQHVVERLRGLLEGVEVLSSTMPALTTDDFLPF